MQSMTRILVADDSLTIRKLVEMSLRESGYEVIVAATGTECLAKANEHKPDLILLDYILPDMQGTEICQTLVNTPETWEIPVLLMSSNGNAIRQLYQDLNNVVDYITKPFAPGVLQAVIAHVLKKSSGTPVADAPEPAPTATAESPAPMENGGQPKAELDADLMNKVNRVLQLLEQPQPAVPAPAAEISSLAEKAPARPRRRRAAAVVAPPPEQMLRKIQKILRGHFRESLARVPEWEQQRNDAGPANYYLSRLLPAAAINELSAELLRAAGVTPGSELGFRCSTRLLPVDTAMRHLAGAHATGELRIEHAAETVHVFFEAGEIVLVSSNNPKSYCAGAEFDFHSVPHDAIAAAVQVQTDQAIPFFIALERSGHIQPGEELDRLLIQQGERTVARAFQAEGSVGSFLPLDKLPATVKASRQKFTLLQLLLVSYRCVDDWLTIEQGMPGMNMPIERCEDFDDGVTQLGFDDDEYAVLRMVNDSRTPLEMARDGGLDPYLVGKVLFRFARLGIIRSSPVVSESPLAFAAAC
jgi:CheY-like chemotaxis protein